MHDKYFNGKSEKLKTSVSIRISCLKENGHWEEVKNRYLELKNQNGDLNKKSRSLRAEAINNVWNKHGKSKRSA